MDCCILCLTQVPNAPEVTKMNFPFTEHRLGYHAHRRLGDGWDCFWGSWGKFSWQPCNCLLMGVVRHLVCSSQMIPSWSPSSPGTPNSEVWVRVVQQPNSEFSISGRIWSTEALMAPHLSPKATLQKAGATLNCASVSKQKALGLWRGLSIASRSLSLHLICIWDIN